VEHLAGHRGDRRDQNVSNAAAATRRSPSPARRHTYGIRMAYQKGAFAFATADMVMPNGVDFAGREVFDGVSMRIVRQYDINADKFPVPPGRALRLQDHPAPVGLPAGEQLAASRC
jgi:hypothetical protein